MNGKMTLSRQGGMWAQRTSRWEVTIKGQRALKEGRTLSQEAETVNTKVLSATSTVHRVVPPKGTRTECPIIVALSLLKTR